MVSVKSIWDSHKPAGEIIVRTRIDNIAHLNCYVATNTITGHYIYIIRVSKDVNIPNLRSYRFKGVEIFTIDLDDSTELNVHLLDNDLGDIFALFIQNIIDDIAETVTEYDAITKSLAVVSKWKRLFDKLNFNGLSLESQKGLIGELLVINQLIDIGKEPLVVLSAWTGADFEDKDFIFESIGIEIKLTSSKNPRISISSERQLDDSNLSCLYLILFVVEEVRKDGFTLNSLIDQTRQKISNDQELLMSFNEKLLLLGYRNDDAGYYNKAYSLRQDYFFRVSQGFPKIDNSSLPMGVYNASYFVEISAAANFIVTFDEILENI